jgi:hypothetical protein
MGALKKRETGYEPAEFKHSRPPTQPDYNDEVSDEQMADLAKRVADCIDSDEWELVDGPAW